MSIKIKNVHFSLRANISLKLLTEISFNAKIVDNFCRSKGIKISSQSVDQHVVSAPSKGRHLRNFKAFRKFLFAQVPSASDYKRVDIGSDVSNTIG